MDEITKRDIPINIEDIMHTAYLQYSLSVNVGRAIPDVRDGLKPVNRRILYAMKQLSLTKGSAYKKSAAVVGEVIGKYHPHGDSSIYDAMVRLTQDFAMREPLVDGQGNFGSIDGDPAAAYRYTECRMERLAEELLSDIDKATVNMLPTYDEKNIEPEVLPAKFPNLLVNGTTGIGVGMATNIPPHNLAEVIDATVHLLENPQASVTDLMQFIPGPDFPTGAYIRGRTQILKLYETGRGSIRMRAKADVVETNGKEQIIITEIPYAVNKERLVKSIADLASDKKITGISDLRDESSRRSGIRIVVDIKRNAMGNVVLNQLFAHTQLESTFGSTMLVVDKNRPRIMNLPQVLQAYIDHRMEVVIRRAKFELNKAEARAHILQGLLKALDNIDEVVRIIRHSQTRKDAAAGLIAKFEFSATQVNAILDMRLHQLTGLAAEDLQSEYDQLLKKIAYLKEVLASRQLRLDIIKEELIEVKEKHGNERRSEITHDDGDLNVADLIERHSCVVTVSNTGYVKRTPADTYKTQHRGGKGIIGMETKDEDYVEHLFNSDSHELMFFFTSRGFMHWLNVYQIPEGSRVSKGKAIINMIKVTNEEKIQTMMTLSKDDLESEDKYLMLCTQSGYIKKTPLKEFSRLRNAGLRALKIDEEDTLIGAAITDGTMEVILSTANGMACRFLEGDVRPMGRGARGVTGIKFKTPNDYVVSMEVVPQQFEDDIEIDATEVDSDEEVVITNGQPQLLVVSDGGMGKRSLVSTYRRTKRAAKGVVSMKLKDGEKVISAIKIESGDELMMTTEKGQLVRIPCDEIRTIGRASKGVKIMNLNDGDVISGISKIVNIDIGKDDSDDNNGETTEENITSEAPISTENNEASPAEEANE
ncbi:DNA gyrase subunit A [Lentisphaerota bacterium WC36G]|nr:DNA gyrase subunit A [Lentisphaerae bacterium WC36]